MERLVIHEKRRISVKSLIFCIVMLVLSAYLTWYGLGEGGFFYLLIGGLGLLYFGYCLVLAILSRTRMPVILTLDEEGVSGSGTASALDFIAYEEIGRVESFKRMRDRYIGITPKDPEAYFERISPTRREAARANLRLNLPPIFLRVEDAVEMNAEAIAAEIERRIPRSEEDKEGTDL